MVGIKRSVRICLSVIITILLIFSMYKLWGSGDIASALSEARPAFLVIAACFYVLTYPVRAFRIYYMAKGNAEIKYSKVLPVCMRHQFYSRIFPFKAGEFYLIYLLKSNYNINVSKGGTMLFLIRFFDGVAIVLSYLICNAFVGMGGIVSKIAIGGLIVLFVCGAFGIKIFPKIISFLRKHKKEKFADVLCDVYGMLGGQSIKDILVMVFATAVLWTFVYLSMHFTALSFYPALSVVETVVASFLASVAAYLPVNGIGGFGTTEAGWTLGFTLIGMDRNTALVSGLVSNLMSFVIICVFGLVSFMKRGGKDV